MVSHSSASAKAGKKRNGNGSVAARAKRSSLDAFNHFGGEPPKNLTEECVVRILSLIKEGKLKAGDRVGEISIAEQIGMSRAPTRSALDRLAQANVLERIHRSGTFVRELSLEEFSETMDVRAYMECLSARLAAQRIHAAEASELLALGREADSLNYDDPKISQQQRYHADTSFHIRVAQLSANRRLFAILENQHLLEFSFLSGFRIYPKNKGLASQIPSHESIAKAIIEHKVDDAGDLMRSHVLKSKQIRLSLALGESTE